MCCEDIEAPVSPPRQPHSCVLHPCAVEEKSTRTVDRRKLLMTVVRQACSAFVLLHGSILVTEQARPTTGLHCPVPALHALSPALSTVGEPLSAGAYSAGLITEEQRQDIVRNACPGAGACGGMYTANTVSSPH